MTEENLIPRFLELLREAFDAQDAVDMFDLDSNDKMSRETWNCLLEEQEKTLSALVAYCNANKRLLPQVLSLTTSAKLPSTK